MTNDKLTAETVTDQQILQLEREANAADDRMMAANCALALGATGSSVDEDGESADPDENEIEGARQRCADAINAARAAVSS